jgi:hypothetical protein
MKQDFDKIIDILDGILKNKDKFNDR